MTDPHRVGSGYGFPYPRVKGPYPRVPATHRFTRGYPFRLFYPRVPATIFSLNSTRDALFRAREACRPVEGRFWIKFRFFQCDLYKFFRSREISEKICYFLDFRKLLMKNGSKHRIFLKFRSIFDYPRVPAPIPLPAGTRTFAGTRG